MVREAEENAESDKQARELIEARNNAEAQLHAAKTDLKDHESKLTEEEKTKVEDAIKALEDVVSGTDKDAMIQKMSDLLATVQVIEQAKAKAAESKTAEPEIVDAEFTETK
jgi:molecular chaperone DnaK